jgi:hypothetical protein
MTIFSGGLFVILVRLFDELGLVFFSGGVGNGCGSGCGYFQ